MVGQQENELRQRKNTTTTTTTTTNNNKKKKSSTTNKGDKNQNNKKKKKGAVVPKPSSSSKQQDENPPIDKDETLYQTFKNHPLIRVTPFVILPYILYHLIYFISLQHPELVSIITFNMIQLRPIVSLEDTRQVLIVGAEVSENRNVVIGLAQKSTLSLEISNEATDATSYFCRDGTISWFQILRFLPPWNDNDDMIIMNSNNSDGDVEEEEEKEGSNSNSGGGEELEEEEEEFPNSSSLSKVQQQLQFQAWNQLCMNRTNNDLLKLFHPKLHRSVTTSCSNRDEWSQCWAKECLSLVSSLWGCAWKEKEQEQEQLEAGSSSSSSSSCLPNFARVLHQTRHPLRTIETLNATFCRKEGLVQPFTQLVSTWFPFQPNYYQQQQNGVDDDDDSSSSVKKVLLDWNQLSCLEVMAVYVIQFHFTMIQAQKAGLVHESFPIETTSPCQLAQISGYLESHTSIYEPHTDRLQTICQEHEQQQQQLSDFNDNDNGNNGENDDETNDNKKKKKKKKLSEAEQSDLFLKMSQQNQKKNILGFGGSGLDDDNFVPITVDDFSITSSSTTKIGASLLLSETLQQLITTLGYE